MASVSNNRFSMFIYSDNLNNVNVKCSAVNRHCFQHQIDVLIRHSCATQHKLQDFFSNELTTRFRILGEIYGNEKIFR